MSRLQEAVGQAAEAVASAPILVKNAPIALPALEPVFRFYGHPLDDWLKVVALAWLFMQMGCFVYDRLKKGANDQQ